MLFRSLLAGTITEDKLWYRPDSFFKDKTQEYKKLIQGKIKGLEKDDFLIVVNNALDDILPFYFLPCLFPGPAIKQRGTLFKTSYRRIQIIIPWKVWPRHIFNEKLRGYI